MNVAENEYFPRLVIFLHCEENMDRRVPGHIRLESQGQPSGVLQGSRSWHLMEMCVTAFFSASGRFGLGPSGSIFLFSDFTRTLRSAGSVCMLQRKNGEPSLPWSQPSAGSTGNSGVWAQSPNFGVDVIQGNLGLPKLGLFSWAELITSLICVLSLNTQNTLDFLHRRELMGTENWQPWVWFSVQLTSCVTLGMFASVSSPVNGENDVLSFPDHVKIKW